MLTPAPRSLFRYVPSWRFYFSGLGFRDLSLRTAIAYSKRLQMFLDVSLVNEWQGTHRSESYRCLLIPDPLRRSFKSTIEIVLWFLSELSKTDSGSLSIVIRKRHGRTWLHIFPSFLLASDTSSSEFFQSYIRTSSINILCFLFKSLSLSS